jgi:hypothetical protein
MLPDVNSIHAILSLSDAEHNWKHRFHNKGSREGQSVLSCRECDAWMLLPIEYLGLCLCPSHKCDRNACLGSAYCDSCSMSCASQW